MFDFQRSQHRRCRRTRVHGRHLQCSCWQIFTQAHHATRAAMETSKCFATCCQLLTLGEQLCCQYKRNAVQNKRHYSLLLTGGSAKVAVFPALSHHAYCLWPDHCTCEVSRFTCGDMHDMLRSVDVHGSVLAALLPQVLGDLPEPTQQYEKER